MHIKGRMQMAAIFSRPQCVKWLRHVSYSMRPLCCWKVNRLQNFIACPYVGVTTLNQYCLFRQHIRGFGAIFSQINYCQWPHVQRPALIAFHHPAHVLLALVHCVRTGRHTETPYDTGSTSFRSYDRGKPCRAYTVCTRCMCLSTLCLLMIWCLRAPDH